MYGKTLAAAVLAGAAAPALALSTGDIAFTSFNADEDGFSIVTFVEISAGSVVHFSDNEWNGTAFNSGEGQHTWTATSAVAAGTVVRFSAVDQAIRNASTGTLVSTGDTGLNATSETIYAFVGTNAATPSTFLAGISTEGAVNLTPAGLTAGNTAVILANSADYGAYSGARTGAATLGTYRTLVNDASNWTVFVGGDQSTQTPDLAPFAPIPEPSTYAMMAAGLVAVGFGLNRGNRRRN